MKRNDLLWKAALEDLFDDFLRFFCADADELFDFEKGFEYLDKELDQLFHPKEISMRRNTSINWSRFLHGQAKKNGFSFT